MTRFSPAFYWVSVSIYGPYNYMVILNVLFRLETQAIEPVISVGIWE